MKLDFSEVKENKMLEEGVQDLIITGAKEARSTNGTNMLVLDMKDSEGGFVRDNICLEGAGAFKAQQLFRALGLSDEDASSMNASDFIGMNVTVEIVSETYKDEPRAKVKKYIAA